MKIAYMIAALIITACSSPEKVKQDVRLVGALKAIMHQGDISAKIFLDSLSIPGVYAIGALDSLQGEIFIENGIPLVSEIINSVQVVSSRREEQAALLVYTKVKDWQEYTVSGSDLELIITEKANKSRLENPFSFMLKGNFMQLDYHVINFDAKKDDIFNHKKGAFQANLEDKDVTILGFYSDHHQGLFTHHDSNMHMHVKNASGTEMGHVDALKIGNDSFTLLLPKL